MSQPSPSPPAAPGREEPRDPRDWLLLTVRRIYAQGAVPPVDLFESRALLELDRHTTARTYANALAKGLAQALGARPVIRPTGSSELSFDEAWLLRLLERAQARDSESVAFLVSSRVAHRHRAALVFLLEGLAARLPERPARRGCTA